MSELGFLRGNELGEPIHGKAAECFIQWKGTNACFDFRCPCGHEGHFDGFFAYSVKCSYCGTVYEMPSLLYPRPIAANENANPVVPGLEEEGTG